MKQICKFNQRPATVNDGGYKKGHKIVWLNLHVTEIDCDDMQNERFQSITDRLVLNDVSIDSFLDEVEASHIAEANSEEIIAILKFFQSEDDLDSWKKILQAQVRGYDSSEHVNIFKLNGSSLWLEKATRVGLINSVSIEKNAGHDVTCLWYGTYHINIQVDEALEALSKVELYALACYNVTAQHLLYIQQCNNIDDLRAFDVAADYPAIIELNIKTL